MYWLSILSRLHPTILIHSWQLTSFYFKSVLYCIKDIEFSSYFWAGKFSPKKGHGVVEIEQGTACMRDILLGRKLSQLSLHIGFWALIFFWEDWLWILWEAFLIWFDFMASQKFGISLVSTVFRSKIGTAQVWLQLIACHASFEIEAFTVRILKS